MSVQQYLDAFFKKTGLGATMKPDVFWRGLERRFKGDAKAFGDCIDARTTGINRDPYVLKNKSLEFANAVASQFDLAKLRAVGIWFIQSQQFQTSERVLEVGCDNGILLCLLASLRPEAQFFGFDRCVEAIERAKERASALGLTNVHFEHCELQDTLSKFAGKTFDLVISVAVFHEVFSGEGKLTMDGFGDHKEPRFSIMDADKLSEHIQTDARVSNIRHLLTADGAWCSLDRLVSPDDVLWWIRKVEASGFCLDFPSSYLVAFKDMSSHEEHFPLTVFTNSGEARANAIDVLAFMGYRNFTKQGGYQEISEPHSAELIYSGLAKLNLYEQQSVFRNGSGTERMEVGLAGGLGFVYQTTSNGVRRLTIFPSVLLGDHLKKIVSEIPEREKTADVSMNIENREALKRLGIELSE